MSEQRGKDRSRSEKALLQSEERYHRLVDLSPDAIMVIQDDRIVLANPAAERMFGAGDHTRIVGRRIADLFHVEERVAVARRMTQVLFGTRPTMFQERRYRLADGRELFVEVAATIYPDSGGPAVLAILRDIAERKRLDEVSRESESRFRQIAETIDEVFWVTPPDKNRMDYVSPAYEKIWGRPCAELYADPRRWLEAIHPGDRDRVIQAAMTKQSEGTYDEEYRIVRPDGRERWIRDRAFPLRDATGTIYRIVGLADDITEKKAIESRLQALSEEQEARVVARTAQLREANDALRQADARQRALLNAIPDVVFRIRGDGAFLDFSAPHGQTFLPPDRIIGGNLMQAAIPEAVRLTLKAAIDRATATDEVVPIEYALATDSANRHFEARVVRSGDDEVVATIRDISEAKSAETHRRRLEQQLRQSQKMEAIGTLAGGIAHDFNNILTAILGYAELLGAQVAGQGAAEERVTEIAKAGSRAKDLVAQILTFSRRQDHARAALRLGPAIEEALKLLRAAIPASIEIDAQVDEDLPPILADATQIQQVVMNLATNASAAMAGGPGRLRVRCRALDLDPAAAGDAALRAGRHVCLTIEDTGCGMPPDVVERIFDPFFTTKGPGEGTGLGLSVVHGIVKAHEGAILVDSRLGEGTSFRVYFPALLQPPDEFAPAPRLAARGHGEHVLCVDDEPSLIELLRDQITGLGYRVTAFAVPADALAAFLERPRSFDVLLTDLTMPVMSGADVVERVREVRPDLPIVMVTGYGHVISEERARELGIRTILQKPFTMSVLGEAIQDALASAKT